MSTICLSAKRELITPVMWKCEVCGNDVRGTREEAEDHTKIIVPERLPKGLVCSPSDGRYIIIDGNDPKINYKHDLIHSIMFFDIFKWRYHTLGDEHVEVLFGYQSLMNTSTRNTRGCFSQLTVSSEKLEEVEKFIREGFLLCVWKK